MFIVVCFFMPETLFDRPDSGILTDADTLIREDSLKGSDADSPIVIEGELYKPPPLSMKMYVRRLWLWDLDRPSSRQLHANTFVVKPLSMLKYPSVLFPALY
jgi:hypothetical protein